MGISFVEENKILSDNDIISKLLPDNYEYLQVIIDRYMPLVISTAKSFDGFGVDTEDLIAEGVLAIFSAVKVFDSSKAKFSTFVSVCIKRAMLTQIKSATAQKRIPESMITSVDELQIDGDNPEDIIIDKENYDSFLNSLTASLSELEYKVLSLFLDGNTYADISNKLDISLKSVDNSLKRVREKIRKNRD